MRAGEYRVVVYGTPAPQGSKHGFVNKFSGKVQMVESSKKVKPWRVDVKAAAEEMIEMYCGLALRNGTQGWKPLDGALDVRIIFTLVKPKSAPKTRVTFPDKKPDLSKLIRSTEDALTDAGLWVDDARIVHLDVLKTFPNEGDGSLRTPGAIIDVRRFRGALGEAWS